MKKVSLPFLLCFLVKTVLPQTIDWHRYSQSFPAGTFDRPGNIGIVALVPQINNSFWGGGSGDAFENRMKSDTDFIRSRYGDVVLISTYDTVKAQFLLHGVNKINAKDYEYRVMNHNGRVIVPWVAITRFTSAADIKALGMPQMAYLGGYNGPTGDWIVVDVRLRHSGKIISTAVVAHLYIQPSLSRIYTTNELNDFLKRLRHPWTSYRDNPKWQTQFFATDNNLIFYLTSDIYNKEQLAYELLKNDKVVIGWRFNDFDNNFVWLKNLEPGKYVLKMRYTAQPEHVTAYAFEIETPWYKSNWFKIAAGILVCAFMGFILFLILNIKQKQAAARELVKKTKLQLELKSIYAQLNPHFIFNALSSIQGLINRQDIKGANNYLSDFARLMRESLNNGNKDEVSLDKEMISLDTYLKLEQLRFGFAYKINAGDGINIYETTIPSLLLQPLVENAVKHGVSALQDKGLVTVNFAGRGNDMLASVTDNGKGFAGDINNSGFGLKLTRDRIKLLNDFSREQPIILTMKGDMPGEIVVELTFKNWFL